MVLRDHLNNVRFLSTLTSIILLRNKRYIRSSTSLIKPLATLQIFSTHVPIVDKLNQTALDCRLVGDFEFQLPRAFVRVQSFSLKWNRILFRIQSNRKNNTVTFLNKVISNFACRLKFCKHTTLTTWTKTI